MTIGSLHLIPSMGRCGALWRVRPVRVVLEWRLSGVFGGRVAFWFS